MRKSMRKAAAFVTVCALVLSAVPVYAQEEITQSVEEQQDKEGVPSSPSKEVGGEQIQEEITEPSDEVTDIETDATTEGMAEDENVPEEVEGEQNQTGKDEAEEDFFANMQEIQVSSGWYELYVFSNPVLNMDIKSGSDNNGANVQVWSDNNSLAQRFYISQKENGWYTLRNISSGKFLTVPGQEVKSSTKLLQQQGDGSHSQEFKFYKEQNGAVLIRPNAGKDLVCDVTGGQLKKGSGLQVYKYNGTPAQQFGLRSYKMPGTEEVIPNGNYRIYPYAAPAVSLDVQGGNINNRANVRLYNRNYTEAQEWKAVRQGEWYKFINVKSGKVLDTKGGSSKPGTNIWQYTSNAGKGQLFKIYKIAENRYCIMSKLGTMLDCAGGSFKSGANVQMYTMNYTAAQEWRFEKIVVSAALERQMEEGCYNILMGNLQMAAAQNSGASGANIRLENKAENGNQAFRLEKQSDGWYMLRNVNSGKYLDVDNANARPGTNLKQFNKNSSNAQKFKFYSAGNGQYYIKSKLFTFVEADVRVNGNIYMNAASCQPAQKWSFEMVIPEKSEVNVANGNYHLYTGLGGNKVLDIANGSKASGGNVQIFTWNGTVAQSFYIGRQSDGWYTIKNIGSGLYLDVKNGKNTSGTNLWQYKGNGSDAQKFKFYDAGGGKVFIKSKLGTVIDVANGACSNGANVQLYKHNNTKAQKWSLKKTANGWRYKDGYKFYYNSKGQLVKDVSSIIGKQSSYEIKVNKQKNVVTVYAKDGGNGYIIPVKSFVCSTGSATMTGTFYTPAKYRWHTLMGPSWGQWCTRINGGVLFHSVYYVSANNNMALSVAEYNKLGTTCSHGCVRLTAGDAKWIYDNCGLKTKVTIYNSSNAGPFGKPTAAKLPSWHTWDPTDPGARYKCNANGCH